LRPSRHEQVSAASKAAGSLPKHARYATTNPSSSPPAQPSHRHCARASLGHGLERKWLCQPGQPFRKHELWRSCRCRHVCIRHGHTPRLTRRVRPSRRDAPPDAQSQVDRADVGVGPLEIQRLWRAGTHGPRGRQQRRRAATRVRNRAPAYCCGVVGTDPRHPRSGHACPQTVDGRRRPRREEATPARVNARVAEATPTATNRLPLSYHTASPNGHRELATTRPKLHRELSNTPAEWDTTSTAASYHRQTTTTRGDRTCRRDVAHPRVTFLFHRLERSHPSAVNQRHR
jgi:hypothetical protein